jgi:MATE efflux family protein
MIEASVHALRLCLYGFAFVGFQVTATQFFQSIGFGGKALLLSLSRQILFLLPALFLFPLLWDATGVWLAMPFSDIAAGVLGMILMYYQFKIFDRKFSSEGL